MVPYLYSLAGKVSRNLYLPGYEKEDLLQECMTVIFAEMHKNKLLEFLINKRVSGYIAQVMRFHLFSLMRKREPINSAEEFIDIFHVPSNTSITIPIPLSNSSARHIVIALLENDFQVQAAAHDLGISYRTAKRHWRIAKGILQTESQRVSLFPQEINSLVRSEYGIVDGSDDTVFDLLSA
jgi:hypothetical protein